jgi:hypothetical protein
MLGDHQLSYCCTEESGICSPTSVVTGYNMIHDMF